MPDEDEFDPEHGLWRPGRRRFLFLFGAAAAGTVVAGKWPAAPAGRTIIAGDFTLDAVQKRIYYTGVEAKGYTVAQLHAWLQDRFDDPDVLDLPAPSVRHTPQSVSLKDGWTIDNRALPHLGDGGLHVEATGERFSSITALSPEKPDAVEVRHPGGVVQADVREWSEDHPQVETGLIPAGRVEVHSRFSVGPGPLSPRDGLPYRTEGDNLGRTMAAVCRRMPTLEEVKKALG